MTPTLEQVVALLLIALMIGISLIAWGTIKHVLDDKKKKNNGLDNQ
jgi:hypothetical protein